MSRKVYLYDCALNIIDVPTVVEEHGDRGIVRFGPFKKNIWAYAMQFEGDKPRPLERPLGVIANDMLHIQFDITPPAVDQTIAIDYTNWRGERRVRNIWPLEIIFEGNSWHPTPQWLIRAIDMEDQKEKTFAWKDIHGTVASDNISGGGMRPVHSGDPVSDGRPVGWTEAKCLEFIGSGDEDDPELLACLFAHGDWHEIHKAFPQFVKWMNQNAN